MSDSFVTPWTIAHQTPLSMDFSRQDYWSGCHSLLKIKLSSLNQHGLGWVLNLMTGVLVKDTEIQREGCVKKEAEPGAMLL